MSTEHATVDGLLPVASLTEFFRDSVDAAMAANHVVLDAQTAHYVVSLLTLFARSEDLGDQGPALDMGALMRTACASVGGRGGGRPMLAQGGAPEGAPVERVLDSAVQHLGDS